MSADKSADASADALAIISLYIIVTKPLFIVYPLRCTTEPVIESSSEV